MLSMERSFCCPACRRTKPVYSKIALGSCSHFFCRECLEKVYHAFYWGCVRLMLPNFEAICYVCSTPINWHTITPTIILNEDMQSYPVAYKLLFDILKYNSKATSLQNQRSHLQQYIHRLLYNQERSIAGLLVSHELIMLEKFEELKKLYWGFYPKATTDSLLFGIVGTQHEVQIGDCLTDMTKLRQFLFHTQERAKGREYFRQHRHKQFHKFRMQDSLHYKSDSSLNSYYLNHHYPEVGQSLTQCINSTVAAQDSNVIDLTELTFSPSTTSPSLSDLCITTNSNPIRLCSLTTTPTASFIDNDIQSTSNHMFLSSSSSSSSSRIDDASSALMNHLSYQPSSAFHRSAHHDPQKQYACETDAVFQVLQKHLSSQPKRNQEHHHHFFCNTLKKNNKKESQDIIQQHHKDNNNSDDINRFEAWEIIGNDINTKNDYLTTKVQPKPLTIAASQSPLKSESLNYGTLSFASNMALGSKVKQCDIQYERQESLQHHHNEQQNAKSIVITTSGDGSIVDTENHKIVVKNQQESQITAKQNNSFSPTLSTTSSGSSCIFDHHYQQPKAFNNDNQHSRSGYHCFPPLQKSPSRKLARGEQLEQYVEEENGLNSSVLQRSSSKKEGCCFPHQPLMFKNDKKHLTDRNLSPTTPNSCLAFLVLTRHSDQGKSSPVFNNQPAYGFKETDNQKKLTNTALLWEVIHSAKAYGNLPYTSNKLKHSKSSSINKNIVCGKEEDKKTSMSPSRWSTAFTPWETDFNEITSKYCAKTPILVLTPFAKATPPCLSLNVLDDDFPIFNANAFFSFLDVQSSCA